MLAAFAIFQTRVNLRPSGGIVYAADDNREGIPSVFFYMVGGEPI
ncbi:hypothetical protein [Brasilonema sennae]|nr:hypothetical protein [Brasilonema sennae]